MSRLITRSAYARLTSVSPQGVSKLCATKLREACVGKRVDLDHSAVREHMASKGMDPAAATVAGVPMRGPRATSPRRATTNAPHRSPGCGGAQRSLRGVPRGAGPVDAQWDDIERYADRSLRELTDMFGTSTAFGDWLAARKRISEIREKDLRNAERDGRLISRDLVRTHVFGALEGLSRRLVSDAPKTLAQRVCALSRSGASLEDVEAVIRDHISSQIRAVKEKVIRSLREG